MVCVGERVPTLNKGVVIATLKQYKVGSWGIVSGSKANKDVIYGVKIYEGQGVVKAGEIVRVLNWKGHEALISVGAKVKSVPETVENKGYTLYAQA